MEGGMNPAVRQSAQAVSDPVIEMRNVVRTYDGGRIRAVDGVSLRICRGDFLAITGPSGCGKSTLLGLMGALDEPDEGAVLFDGAGVRGGAARARLRSSMVGFIFQSFHLLPTLSAIENVQIPMFEMPWSRAQREDRAKELLVEVGLEGRFHHLPGALSGGERQRVAAARSLANNPRVVLADEPTGNLDSVSSARLVELLGRLHAEKGLILVVATHDPVVAAAAGSRVFMKDGRLSEHLPGP